MSGDENDPATAAHRTSWDNEGVPGVLCLALRMSLSFSAPVCLCHEVADSCTRSHDSLASCRYAPAQFIEEIQQDGNAVGGPLTLLRPSARIQNDREALAVRRQVVRIIAADICQAF